MRPPKPKDLRLLLPLYGRLKRTTWHSYVLTRACVVVDDDVNGPDAWEHIYQCEVTGAQRRWGLEKLVLN